MIEALVHKLAERFHRMQIRTDRCLGVSAAHEFLAHPLDQYGHEHSFLCNQHYLFIRPTRSLGRPASGFVVC